MSDIWARLETRRQAPPPPPAKVGDGDIWQRLEQRKEFTPVLARTESGLLLKQVRDVDQLSEIDRILALPVYDPSLWDGAEFRKKEGFTLRPVQQQALASLAAAGGGVLPIGVGWGKSAIALLAGNAAAAELVIVLVPPRTVDQMYQTLAMLDNHFRLPRIEIVSYSSLSLAKNSDMFTRLIAGTDPAKVIVVADEAHSIKHFNTARTKRVARFFHEHPEVKFVAMSGTLTSRSLNDFAHLAQWALGAGSPVPKAGSQTLSKWAGCLDSATHAPFSAKGCQKEQDADWVWVEPLWQWAGCAPYRILQAPPTSRREGARQAFRQRLVTTKGVVATDENSCGVSLYIEKWNSLAVPEEVKQACILVEDTKCNPRGEPLVDAVAQWRLSRQLSLGFYYTWAWPNGVVDWQWLEARSAWHKCVRAELDYHSKAGYDSALLVYNHTAKMYKEGARKTIHLAWKEWEEVKGRPVPPTEAIWLSTATLDTVLADVLKDKEPTIIWCSDKAVSSYLRGKILVVAPDDPIPKKAQTCVMSVKSHGTGLNLQAWSKNLILSIGPSGLEFEQLVGRTHRPMQQADEVWVTVLAHTPAFIDALSKVSSDARYLQDTTGQQQKLLLATIIEK